MSMGGFSFMMMTLFWFKWGFSAFILGLVMLGSLAIFTVWFRDITRESGYQGHHTSLVQGALKWGLAWFLFSEVWFFFSVFWSFFHFSLTPMTGAFWVWPSFSLETIPPFQVPLLNTVILVMSGLTATLGHHELMMGRQTSWIFISVGLGAYFMILQGMEYGSSFCSISTGAYGSVFFFGTGFHGFHVCIGGILLLISSLRASFDLLSNQHHFSLEFSLWYWHFVDVVWLFLFCWIYAWGS